MEKMGVNLLILFNILNIMLTVKSIVNTILESRTYILEVGRFDFWIVDPGDVEKIMEIVDKSRVLKGILLTHIHYDHIYGLPALVRIFPSAIIYTNEAGIKALASAKLNLSKYYDKPIVCSGENIKVVCEEDSITLLDGINAKVIETPGHSPTCITYHIENYIFSGDSYIPGYNVVTNLPNCNKKDAATSKARIIRLAENRILCPGHLEKVVLAEKGTVV